MNYTLLLIAALALLCAHWAWMIIKLNGIDKRTASFEDSLRANESVAERIDAEPSRVLREQRPIAQNGHDPFVELIRHLEAGRPGEARRDEPGLVPVPPSFDGDAARR